MLRTKLAEHGTHRGSDERWRRAPPACRAQCGTCRWSRARRGGRRPGWAPWPSSGTRARAGAPRASDRTPGRGRGSWALSQETQSDYHDNGEDSHCWLLHSEADGEVITLIIYQWDAGVRYLHNSDQSGLHNILVREGPKSMLVIGSLNKC